VATLLTAGSDRAIDTVWTGAALYWDGVVLLVGVALTLQWMAILLYDWVLHAVSGRSVGKAVTGLRVVPVEWLLGDYRQRRPGLGRAALRTSVRVGLPGAATVVLVFALMDGQPALFAAGGLLAALSYVDLLWLAVVRDGRRACLHDRASRTVVVPARWVRQVRLAHRASGPAWVPPRVPRGPETPAGRVPPAGLGMPPGPPGVLPRRSETGR